MNALLDRSPRVIVITLAAVLLGFLVLSGCAPVGAEDVAAAAAEPVAPDAFEGPAPKVGEMAPDFTLPDLDGNQVSLLDLRGKIVFLNFWATWCPPCRAEMPEMEIIYQEYKDMGLAVIGIDIQESEDEVRSFIEEAGYSWTFLLDTTGKVTVMYQVSGIPTSYFIDEDGIIRAINIGAMSRATMDVNLALTWE